MTVRKNVRIRQFQYIEIPGGYLRATKGAQAEVQWNGEIEGGYFWVSILSLALCMFKYVYQTVRNAFSCDIVKIAIQVNIYLRL
jgi:hypothetical protein